MRRHLDPLGDASVGLIFARHGRFPDLKSSEIRCGLLLLISSEAG
jgi:hypothetical protein